MSETLTFNLERGPAGRLERVAPQIRRLTADNPGPHTFTGTNSYIVGEGTVAVIDPGPADEAHLDRLCAALAGETVSHILVSHTHRDHSPLAGPLARRTGAMVVGCHAGNETGATAGPGIEASGDRSFRPDITLRHGERVAGAGWTLEALHTPGHASNHLCYALAGTGALFSGDHVMGWSTTMVAPPDGDMGAYFASLALLGGRGDEVYWPGHGGRIAEPAQYVRALTRHREARERAIRGALGAAPQSAQEIARRVYQGLEPRLERSAALTALAHLVHLAEKGEAVASGAAGLETRFRASA
jgi:glyoxylase-like metal-dependent hydrolase (beta-lactamase superfamily II)